MVIATTSTAVSAAIAAGSADPLVLGSGCRLSWPNSASDGMVNRPIPRAVAVATQFSSLASHRGGRTIGTHLAWVSLNLCRTGLCQGSTAGRAVAIDVVWVKRICKCISFSSGVLFSWIHVKAKSRQSSTSSKVTVFYTPPHLPMESSWSTHKVRGVFMGCSWSVHGVLMECSWSAYGVHGVFVECSWSVRGVLMECLWSAHGVHGVHEHSMSILICLVKFTL